MAQKEGKERFTRWTHVENDNVLNRRLHRIEIQAKDGRLYVLKGEQLPDFIQTCTGQGHVGEHIAQILLHPKPMTEPEPDEPPPKPPVWPTARDALNAALGFAAFIIGRFILNALLA